MAEIVVCGGSVIGSAMALMLAEDGHDVVVLEADPDGAPDSPADAWSAWKRGGVPQFHQAHYLMPRLRAVCDQELPGVTDDLRAAGGVETSMVDSLPPTITEREPRPADDQFRLVTARRPVAEHVFAGAAARHPRITVERGRRVAALVAGPAAIAGVPHVVGVRTGDGAEIRAELVVDAMGRRSPGATWVAALGARPPYIESEDAGFVYYTRYFTAPELPRRLGPNLMPMGSFSLITLYGDNNTWSVTVFGPTGDPALKALRGNEIFARVVGACPMQAHWIDGTPLTDVLPMAGILDRYRRFVVDGQPVVTGFVAVGDAWACTNPSAGRGLSVGMMHAQTLRAVVREHLDDPAVLVQAWDERTEVDVTPYYRAQIASDRARFAEMEALRNGEPPAPTDPMTARFTVAAMHDPDVFRGLLQIVGCLATPAEVLSRPLVRDRITSLGEVDLPRPPGPDRARLLELVAS